MLNCRNKLQLQNCKVNARSEYYWVSALVIIASGFLNSPVQAAYYDPTSPEITGDPFSNLPVPGGSDGETKSTFEKFESSLKDEAKIVAKKGLENINNGKIKEGLEDLSRAWEIDPELYEAGVMIAFTYLREKDYDKALDIAEKLQKVWPKRVEGYNLSGVAYAGLGQTDKAKAAFKKSNEIEPGNQDASVNLASYASQEKNIDQARKILENALLYNHGNLKLLLQLSELEAHAGNDKRTTDLLNQAVEANPQAPEPRVILGRYFLSVNKPQETLKIIEPIRKQYAKAPQIIELTGRSELMSGKAKDAEETFAKWIEAEPKAALPHFFMAQALERQKLFPDAIKELDNAIKLEPKYAPSILVKAKILTMQGKFSDAQGLLDELEKAYPGNPSVAEQEGKIAILKNDPKAAVSYFETAFRKLETNTLALQLANAQIRAGERGKGMETLKKWLEKYPDDLLARTTLADFQLAGGDLDQAQQNYSEVLRSKPDDIGVLNNLAWILMQKGKLGEALKNAEKAHQLAPNETQISDTLAVILLHKYDVKNAEKLLRDIVKQSPDNPSYRFHLAQALVHTGNVDEAKKILKDVLSEKQPFKEAKEAEALLTELESK
jgi:cellulose synthase operon protein C